MEICNSWISIIKNSADLFGGVLIILIAILIIGFIFYLKYNFCRKYEKWEKEKRKSNNKSKNEYFWQCLLIDGAWGSGKTTHYEKYYQYIDDKPNIYISCFSASRSELIAQIIQQRFRCKLLTLNGLLAKLMESNWQIFMPKNRVVVFDDLERLHTNQDNYLDLIGVIYYLKTTNKCKIILIADISKTQQIFNAYMERVVDEFLTIPKLQLMNLFSLEYNDKKYHNICTSIIESKSPIITELLNQCQQLHDNSQLNNLRIFKNEFLKLVIKVLKIQEKDKWGENRQIIYAKFLAQKFQDFILKRYIFFIDNVLFNSLCSSAVSFEAESPILSRINKQQKPSEPDILKARELNERLQKYTGKRLQASSFSHKDSKLFNEELDIDIINVELIEFVLYQPQQFIQIKPKDGEPFEEILLGISKDRQLNLTEWKIYLRDDFISRIIKKLRESKTWIPKYRSGNDGHYSERDFSSYYQMAMILTQIGVDNLLISEVIDTMVSCERHNTKVFGDSPTKWIIDDSMNTSIKENLWNDKFYSLVWFLDYDIAYESNTIKDQVNQEIDKIFTDLRNKIKQKLNNGTH